MRIRNYADIVQRILHAVKKSERLTVWHQAKTAPPANLSLNPPYPLYCLHYTSQQNNSSTIYVSAGIHGDEPAGVECAIRLIEQLANNEEHNHSTFPIDKYNWLISPCDNPFGYEQNIRENDAGLDLNRMFRTPHQCPETAFISESLLCLQCQPFRNTNTKRNLTIDLALDLHEDSDSNGFYLWERRTSQCFPIGNAVIKNVEGLCPINRKPIIENHCNGNGVITLLDKITTKGWTRGRYLAEQVNTRCLILETPTQLEWETRIGVHRIAIQTAIKHTFL